MNLLNTNFYILTINVGSSNIKLALFKIDNGNILPVRIASVQGDKKTITSDLQTFIGDDYSNIKIISYRFVLLNENIHTPCFIEKTQLYKIEECQSLAPLHNPMSFFLVKTCMEYFNPSVYHSLHADTDFFKALPDIASSSSLPKELLNKCEIKKHGFHGLAHRSMFEKLQHYIKPLMSNSKIITLQIGSGCSICAINNNRPLDVSMGYSTLGGLIMSTRYGDIDPGILFKLHKKCGLNFEEIESVLTHKSGLLGLSNFSSDMKTLIQSDTKETNHAIRVFCINIRKHIGAYIALLGGIDYIVIGGGIGEHSHLIRNEIFKNLACFGIKIDRQEDNIPHEDFYSIDLSPQPTNVFVCKVNEEEIMAQDAWLLFKNIEKPEAKNDSI